MKRSQVLKIKKKQVNKPEGGDKMVEEGIQGEKIVEEKFMLEENQKIDLKDHEDSQKENIDEIEHMIEETPDINPGETQGKNQPKKAPVSKEENETDEESDDDDESSSYETVSSKFADDENMENEIENMVEEIDDIENEIQEELNSEDEDTSGEEELEGIEDEFIMENLFGDEEEDQEADQNNREQEEIEMRNILFQIMLQNRRRLLMRQRQNWRFGPLGQQLVAMNQDQIKEILDKDYTLKIENKPLQNHPLFLRKKGQELVYFSSEKQKKQAVEEPEEEEEETEMMENEIIASDTEEEEKFDFYCIVLNTKTGILISKNLIKFDNSNIKEHFKYLRSLKSRSSISEDRERVLFYLFESLLEYNIEKNKLTIHNAKDVELGGQTFHIEADCMNQDYNDYLIVELYNEFVPPGDLVFYKYDLKNKHYYKLYQIVHRIPQRFTHSYCKIDRNALHGNEDCMFIFKYCRHQFYPDSIEVYLFYINLVTKRSLYKAKFCVQGEEAYYREAIYKPFLWNDTDKFVIRLGPKSILVFYKYGRRSEIFRSDDENDFNKFVGIFDIGLKEVIEKRLLPRNEFKFLKFGDKVLLMSNFAFSCFGTFEFENLNDYAVVTSVFDDNDKDHFFIQFPFLGVDLKKELTGSE